MVNNLSMKICFLDGAQIKYNSEDIYSNKIRGAENALINLAIEFSKLNNEVTVYNNCNKNIKIEGVNWININNINDSPNFDLAITNNDIRLFNKVNSTKKVAISHSIQSIEKFIRKGQLFAYFKHKPRIALLSKYHKDNRNFLIRMFGSFNISWGVDKIFLDFDINKKNIDKNRAIFTSYTDRNLNLLIKIWSNYIFKFDNTKKLLITPINKDYTRYNIHNRKFGDKKNLISDLCEARMLLIPGHKAELFCISAEEGRELCVPIVTLGKGCLKERVDHGITGFIAKNEKEFANYAYQLFNDDNIWNSMKKNLFKLRGSKKWNDIANQFLKYAYEYN